MSDNIGSKLKDLREYYNITQTELSENICSQRNVSKIELGQTIPTVDILNKLAIRLGVDITYFLNENEAPRFNYIEETKKNIEELVSLTKYNEALEIVKHELKNPLFRKPAHKKFLLWKRAICHFHLTDEKEEALELIHVAMDIETNSRKTITVTDIELHITLGIMNSELKNYEESKLYYEKAHKMCEKFPKIDTNIQLIKVYYNSSLTSFKMRNYSHSIIMSNKGIAVCLKINSLFLLGELYYQQGLSYYYSNKVKSALIEMRQSMNVFKIKQQQAFYEFVEYNYLNFQRAAINKLHFNM
ncbi:helix-turn-helix domain-containing protein [Sinobaca sp. H24]|uniref:helix-turn-helix domain-containing protein n=1 Tax=Sinobaca sp. H24 TaxID=2923376 RepID=UPI0020797DD0|nr:helix-turn-helix domain-containing protein [Sinobaca sp. H24]